MSQGVSMKRRKIDPETKTAAVLEGLRGYSSIADIRRKYEISESLYYRWRDKFSEAGNRALASKWLWPGSCWEGQDCRTGTDNWQTGGKDRDFKKNFRVSLERYVVAFELLEAGYQIQAICEVVGVSCSGFYRWRRRQQCSDFGPHPGDQTAPSVLGLSPGAGLAEIP